MNQNKQSEPAKLLEVRDLEVSFYTPAGEVKAVGGISYDLKEHEVMGIVGESGSGKSVEAYSIIGLLQNPGKVIGGSIVFEGENVLDFDAERMRQFRGNKVSMIFQNPMTCLNPVYTIGDQLMEALTCHNKDISRKEARERAEAKGDAEVPTRSKCWSWSASTTRKSVWTSTRTSFPAVCASAQ